jgi:sugar lactone lactonase YvrE
VRTVVIVSFLAVASAASAQLPLGKVSNVNSTSCGSGFATGAKCYSATVSCPNMPDLGATWGETGPGTAGTIVFVGGSGDTSTAGDVNFSSSYIKAGFNFVQVIFDANWEGGSVLTGACRPATMLSYFRSQSTGPYCAHGSSAGSAAVAYAMLWYGVEFDNVEFTVGPVFSDIKQGCQVPYAAPVTVTPTNGVPFVDNPWYNLEASTVSTWTDTQCLPAGGSTPADLASEAAQSIVQPGATLSFPRTSMSAWVCNNGLNPSAAQSYLFLQQVATPWALTSLTGCTGPEETDTAVTPQGVPAVAATVADMAAQCKANRSAPVISWAAPAPIPYGTALGGTQLNATANVPGSFAYSPATGTVLTTGSQTLSVLFTPNDGVDYTAAKATVALQVNAAATAVVWPNPAAITYGATLGAAQLDATATPVSTGTFVYSPPAGTVLGAGSQALSVSFTPADSTDYKPSSGGAVLQVNPLGLTVSAVSAYGTYGQPLPPLTYTISGFVNGDTQSSATSGVPSEGTAASSTSAPGAYPLVISQGSLVAANYSFTSFVPGVLTLQQAASAVTITSQQSSLASNQTTTLTATVSVTGSGAAPTQSVNFMSGALLLGTATVSAIDAADSTATVTLSGSQLALGANSITAVYSGDANYGGSTSTSIAVTSLNTAGGFGSVNVGTAAPVQALSYNFAADTTLSAVNILAAGAANLDYTDGGGSTCIAGAAYTAGQSCVVNVGFTPSAPGLRSGGVTLFAQGSNLPLTTWYLNGVGQSSAVTFDPGVQSTLAALANNGQAAGAAVDGAGNVYVLDSANSQLIELAAGSFAPSTLISSGLNNPTAIALDGAGNLYISDTGNARVVMVPDEQGTLNPADLSSLNIGGLVSPGALATDGSGDLYVADVGAGDVIELPAGGGAQTVVISGLTGPQGLAIDSAGNFYVAGNNQVVEYPAGGGTPVPMGSGFNNPSGVAVDASGVVYVADSGNARIVRLAAGGTVQSSMAIAGLSNPQGIALDAAGNVYVSDTNLVYQLNRTQSAALIFGNTGVGSTSAAQSVTVSDEGNQPLAISNLALATNFAQVASGGTDCASHSQVASAGQCQVAVVFAPGSAGVLPGTFTLNDNSLNNPASVHTVSLSGSGLLSSQTITFPLIPPQVYGGAAFALYATASSGLPVSYSVIAGSATVSGNLLTITGAGPLTIQASQGGNGGYVAATPIAQTVSVSPAATTVTWSSPSSVTYGTALSASQLNASANVPGSFVYSPSSGAVLGAGSQTLSVSFTPNDSADYNSSTGGVTLVVNPAATHIAWTPPAAIAYGTALSGLQLNATANVSGSFAYSPPAGTVLNAGSQTLAVSFTPADGTDYLPSSAVVSLQVTPASQVITFTQSAPASAAYNSSFAVAASASSGLPVSYSGSGVCSNTGATFIMTSGTGTCTVTATQSGNGNYSAAAAVKQSTTATKAAATVTFAGAPNSAVYQSSFAVVATTNSGATATIKASGACSVAGTTVSLTSGTGTCTLTASWAATANYLSATAKQVTTANKLVPTIGWATPAPITYGAALTSAQLNANANAAGTFVYSPSAGAVLAAGSRTLSVTFTPTLTQDYTTQTAKLTVTVNKTGSTTTITGYSPNPATVGQPVAFQFSVTPASGYGTPTGRVTLNAGSGGSCAANLAAGAGVCSITFKSTGPRTITATYSGDSNDNASVSAAVSETVN